MIRHRLERMCSLVNSDALAKSQRSARGGDVGAFVRGYFLALESRGIAAAALHGWAGGFDRDLSDVDLVMSPEGFAWIAEGVQRYAAACGWRLCQVLRHESTAAFCVCSWSGDPARVVALDGCSDYRRRERVLLPAEELLGDRVRLEWGGYRLGAASELRYRFLKAAVKGKNAHELAPALAAYPEEARADLAGWLRERWRVELGGWDAPGIARAWEALGPRTLRERIDGRGAALRRIAWRVTRPTGLVLATANAHQAAAVAEAFGRLYFRRTASVDRFRCGAWQQLVASTLLCCGHVGHRWRVLLGRDMLVDAAAGEEPVDLVARITALLEARCARRERLGGGN